MAFGSGSSIYGLEFAKSLHIDKEFLNVANDIRKRLADDYTKVERISQKNSSKYNSNLYTSTCIICGRACDEVHHIQEQKKANKDGFIGHINANHKYNLIPLCKLHHKMVHDGKINVNGFVATSKGLELHYTMIEE
jgi:DNA mismatch repair protein MutS